MITQTFVTQIRTIFDEKYRILSCKSQSTFEVKNNNQENIEPNIIDKKRWRKMSFNRKRISTVCGNPLMIKPQRKLYGSTNCIASSVSHDTRVYDNKYTRWQLPVVKSKSNLIAFS